MLLIIMKNKLLCLLLRVLTAISCMPVSVFTVYATQNDNLEIDKEVISPKLILDEKSDIKDVSVYKILDGSEYDKDAFGFISYTDAFKDNIAKDYLEVDDFYNKLLDLFN